MSKPYLRRQAPKVPPRKKAARKRAPAAVDLTVLTFWDGALHTITSLGDSGTSLFLGYDLEEGPFDERQLLRRIVALGQTAETRLADLEAQAAQDYLTELDARMEAEA